MSEDKKTRREELREIYRQDQDSTSKTFIPAKEKVNIYDDTTQLRVCAYCRVSTDNDAQLSSYELQKKHYEGFVGEHPTWHLEKIYADEGISGTSLKHRDQFNEMIAECRKGKYDLIVTKAVSRFARNLVDCISLIRELRNQNPPVGVYFETDKLFTLSEESELKLSIFATFAQEESQKKSESMNWSLKERFKHGQLLTPELFGYRRPRDEVGNYIKYGKLEIEESEAAVVRFIYNAFLAGYSTENIAEMLTDIGVTTKAGKTSWNAGSVGYILRNERYCGSVLTWKTFTADVFEHKKRKNNHDRDQYLYNDFHPAIISVEQFEAVQQLLVDRRHGMRGGYNVMHVIENGVFQGFVPINHHWVNDDPNEYYAASSTVQRQRQEQRIRRSTFSAFDLTGYQVVRGLFLTARSEQPCMTVYQDKLFFNSACTKKLTDIGYIQLLLHPTERKMAIRPCQRTDVYSIRWSKIDGKPLAMKTINCPHFIRALMQIMEWNPEYSYRIMGTWIEKGNDRIMTFNLSNAVPMMQVQGNESSSRKKNIVICPEEWESGFGDEFYEFSLQNNLYYMANNVPINSGAHSVVANGTEQLSLPTAEDVKTSYELIKKGRDNPDE